MRNLLKFSAALGCLLSLASADAAMARRYTPHRHHGASSAAHSSVAYGRRPLAVERRSFLDPGVQVPVGTGQLYVRQPAYEWGDPVSTYQRGLFMDSFLHEAFDPQPKQLLIPLEFWP